MVKYSINTGPKIHLEVVFLTEQKNQKPKYYLISDAVGSLVNDIFQSVSVQFPSVDFAVTNFPFVQHDDMLLPILKQARLEHASIIASFIDKDLNRLALEYCETAGIFYVNVLDRIMSHIVDQTDVQPSGKPGIRHQLDDVYYKRIEALEFAVQNDDGQHPKRFVDADIVLLGISRTSKTPLSMYLANMGYKVANLPLVPESRVPDIIFEIDRSKIIGLTNDVNVLNKFRRERMRSYGIENASTYTDDARIEKELAYANDLYEKLNCPVINVADRSIEETATLIMMFFNAKQTNN
jgi:regulator of PEP synthase PpsR (kinase-PPPase family)